MSYRSASRTRILPAFRIAAAVGAAVLVSGSVASATDYNFNAPAATPADFNLALDWLPLGVPSTGDAAFISGGRIATVSTGASNSISQLNLGANGNTGTGELRVSGGTFVTAGAALGHDAGTDAGTLTITGGSFSDTGNFVMGEQGTGDNKIVISAGSLSLPGENYLGANGNGSILISGTANVTLGRQDIGNGGTATGLMSISGGTVAINGDTYVGLNGAGTLNISGGSINNAQGATPGALRIGQENQPNARGIVTVTGGITTVGVIVMGEQSRQDNQLNISAGTLTDNNDFYNGANGNGSLTVSGTGVLNVGSQMHIGAGTTGVGSLTVSGGTLTETGNGDGAWILVGQNGTGTFSQTGGSISTNRFAVGQDPNSTGTGTQSAGSLRAKFTIVVGETTPNNNVLNLTGGTTEVGTDGLDPDGYGIFVGSYSGHGTLNVSGTSAVTVHNGITIGYGAGSAADGTINVSAGSFKTLNTGDEGRARIGVYGGSTGRLNVSGTGAVTFGGPILNGVAFGGSGVGGTGLINVTGGSLTAAAMTNEATSSYTQSAGTASLGVIDGAGTTSVSGGTLNATRITQSALSVTGTGNVKIANAATPAASVVGTLTTGGTGKLDITNNGVIVDYSGATSPIASVRTSLKNGQIVSTLTPADGRQGVAYGEASALSLSSFLGTPVDTTAVVIRSRLKGDTNFNGNVDFNDLVVLAQHYGLNAGNNVWTTGDFNYDGNVDFNDLVPLAQNYGGDVGAISSTFGARFAADFALAQALAPEPTSLILAAASATLIARRRRSV